MSVSEARHWWDSHLQSIARPRQHGAAYNAMVEECTKEQLAEMVLDLMHGKREMAKVRDARVTELLTANNVEVERRRGLRRELDICELALARALALTDYRHIPTAGGIVAYGIKIVGDQVMSCSLPKEDKS
jgi:hypothetical protein